MSLFRCKATAGLKFAYARTRCPKEGRFCATASQSLPMQYHTRLRNFVTAGDTRWSVTWKSEWRTREVNAKALRTVQCLFYEMAGAKRNRETTSLEFVQNRVNTRSSAEALVAASTRQITGQIPSPLPKALPLASLCGGEWGQLILQSKYEGISILEAQDYEK